jgi:[acyl-carrier-protein] S-malonyltransferase
MSLVLLFPGQGSQYVGMGKKWLEKYPYLKDYYKRANDALGFSIEELCFNGPEEKLVKTEYTQPAILLTSIVMLEVFKKELDLNFSFVAGHSLGEYSALVAAGAISLEDGLKIVNLRGQLMQKAVPVGLGKMAALRKCPESLLNEKIKIITEKGQIVAAANFNSDSQIVVSGSKTGVDLLIEEMKKEKIKALPLNVSAPFHSPLMTSIVDEFKNALEKLNINDLKVSYAANVDAKTYSDKSVIVENLAKQIPGSVMWKQTINNLKNEGVTKAIEVGPGRVLTGLCMKINDSFPCAAMDMVESLEDLN